MIDKNINTKKIGAEVILSVIIAPFLLWVTTAIFNLQSSIGADAVKFEQIKELLDKHDQKLDNITNILIEKRRN